MLRETLKRNNLSIITMLRYFTIDEIQNASEAVDKPNIGHSTERNRALVVVSKE